MDPGPKARDLAVAIDRALRMGMSWVALRAGDAAVNDGQFDAKSIRAWKDAGFYVAPWLFARLYGVDRQIAAVGQLADMGVDGFIWNAEFDFAAPTIANQIVARQLCEGTRRVAPKLWLAHAPPDYEGSRTGEPWDTFDDLCDHILPQVYAWEHNDAGHVYHLARVMARYVASGVPLSRVWPVLCSYRPKYRGVDSNGKSIPTPKMLDEARVVANDLLAGLEHAWVAGSRAPSIYSLDAISWINGPSDCVVSTVEAWRGGSESWIRLLSPLSLQSALVALGRDLGKSGPNDDGIDGDIGPKTRAGIEFEQERAGLPKTGIADETTLRAIAAHLERPIEPINFDDPRGLTVGGARTFIRSIGFELPEAEDELPSTKPEA